LRFELAFGAPFNGFKTMKVTRSGHDTKYTMYQGNPNVLLQDGAII